MRSLIGALLAGLALLLAPVAAADPPTETAFRAWLAAAPERAAQFARFEAALAREGVSGVVPTYELWRTASSAAACQADPFVVPEEADWPNLYPTLRFVRDHVEPAIGEVEVASGYRDDRLNACSGGRPFSAHRRYFALDLLPLDPAVTRADLIERLCDVHAKAGPAAKAGLGFYSRTRFHVDTMRFRRWGADGSGATSPCALQPR